MILILFCDDSPRGRAEGVRMALSEFARGADRLEPHSECTVICGDCGPGKSARDRCPTCGGHAQPHAQPLPNQTLLRKARSS